MSEGRRSKLSLYAATLLIALALLEAGSFAAIRISYWVRAHYLPWGRAAREVHAREGIDFDVLRSELDVLYRGELKLQPYRWYALPESFHGTYVNTDRDGFRLSPPPAGNAPLMAFFGGSTMFSTSTSDPHSIPAYLSQSLDPAAIQARNFGVGGYSSSAELPLFIEELRRNRIAVAVFYDGVNEVDTYLPMLQDHPSETYWDVIGYPQPYSYVPALRHTASSEALLIEPYTVKLARLVWQHLPIGIGNANFIVTEANVDTHAEHAASIYLRNLEDIAALAASHGVTPVFFWQPNIYTTKKPFSDYERGVAASQPAARLLSVALHNKVLASPILARYRFVDLTDALDGMGAETEFLDDAHVSFEANRIIAARMAAALQAMTPQDYWKKTTP